jgi:putative membrane protein
MVGLLYLPRLFVYHYDTKHESKTDKTFLLMEYRLLKIIMKPAMVLTYIFGFLLVYDNSYLLSEVYFILKLFFVFFLLFFISIYIFFTKTLKKVIDLNLQIFIEK